MSSRKVAPANLGFAQNANIVGRTLYRKNTAVEAIVLKKKKYFNYIKEVQAAINENTPAIVALTKCLPTFYGTNDNDNNIDAATDKSKFTIKVFSTLLKTFASSATTTTNNNNNNQDGLNNTKLENIKLEIWNIIFQCVTEFVNRTVTAESKTAVTTVSKNNMHDKNEEKVDDNLTNQNADDEKPKTKSNLGLPVEENPNVQTPIITNEIAKQLYKTITIFSNNEPIQNYISLCKLVLNP